MSAPINALKFVHAALVAEVEAIEAKVAGAETPAEAGEVKEALAFLTEVIDLHTRGEELGLFPPMAERAPHIADTYLADHEAERAQLTQLADAVAACAGGDADALREARRLTVALTTHVRSHVNKENTLVLPWVAEHFSPPEQGAMVQKIVSTIPPDKMAATVPWIIDRIPLDMAEAYLRALEKAMPPPAFAAAQGWVKGGCRPERVGELKARMPTLSL